MFLCSQVILQLINSNPKYKNIYNKINPILFDVSLRDGIQNANIENFPTNKKIDIFHNILNDYNPQNIEIGSLTNPKILPIMNDTLELYKYSKNYIQEYNNLGVYILIPAINKLTIALKHNVTHFSFITSVSNSFQLRNTNKSLKDTKDNYKTIFETLKREPNYHFCYTKLYISCINKCPIIGKIDNDFIINELLYYHNDFSFDELCISDTCGELSFTDFKYIIDKCLFLAIPPSKFSLHLHISPENITNIENILFYSFQHQINKYDISLLETGGCSVTMKPENINKNLSYDLFYQILLKYIENQITLKN